MPLIYQYRIYRQDLQANPNTFYIFGDNAQRVGMGGQAKEMRGEPNAIGIATKWRSTMDPCAFFTDARYAEQADLIINNSKPVFAALGQGKVVVMPLDGIGTGLSEVPQRSPATWTLIQAMVEAFKNV